MAMFCMVDKDDACMCVIFEDMDEMVEKVTKILVEELSSEEI